MEVVAVFDGYGNFGMLKIFFCDRFCFCFSWARIAKRSASNAACLSGCCAACSVCCSATDSARCSTSACCTSSCSACCGSSCSKCCSAVGSFCSAYGSGHRQSKEFFYLIFIITFYEILFVLLRFWTGFQAIAKLFCTVCKTLTKP